MSSLLSFYPDHFHLFVHTSCDLEEQLLFSLESATIVSSLGKIRGPAVTTLATADSVVFFSRSRHNDDSFFPCLPMISVQSNFSLPCL